MTLDLSQIALQVEAMATHLQEARKEQRERLQGALKLLKDTPLARLKDKLQRSRTTWLMGEPLESPASRFPAGPCPPSFTVLAADGSHIDVDRHSPARCYLINLGLVVLRYGPQPDARLESQATLYTSEKDMVLSDPRGSGAIPLDRELIGVKRAVEEAGAIARLIASLQEGEPALALLDGSLILWTLSGRAYPDYVKEYLLQPYLDSLAAMRQAGERFSLAPASYISAPRSTEAVNLYRLALCPYDPADCDRHCWGFRAPGSRPCDGVAGLEDRDLFQELLAPGERSAAFASRSAIITEHYGEHQVAFFYLRHEEEVARVEFPWWGMSQLPIMHAIILDQCQRGQGYPVALSEAHEKAVVTAADREQFQRLVDEALEERQLPSSASPKRQSKQRRWI